MQRLAQQPQTPREVVAAFAPTQADEVKATLRELVDAGALRYEADGQLRTAQ